VTDRTQARLRTHLAAQLEEHRVESNGVALALEHDDLGVVEEPLARRALEGARGAHQRAREGVDGQVDDKFGPHRPRVREHHDEEPECTRAAGDWQLADVGPVDLRLLPDQRLGAQVHLAARRRSHLGDEAAYRGHPTDEAALADHVVDPSRPQAWVLSQLLDDEVMIGLDDSRSLRTVSAGLPAAQDALDHIGMQPELRRDRPDRPVLDVVQPDDLRVLRRRRRGHRTPRRWRGLRSPRALPPRRRRPGSTTSTW
jgi:hypothetical protein